MAAAMEISPSSVSPILISFADENVQRQIGIRRMGYLKKLKVNFSVFLFVDRKNQFDFVDDEEEILRSARAFCGEVISVGIL